MCQIPNDDDDAYPIFINNKNNENDEEKCKEQDSVYPKKSKQNAAPIPKMMYFRMIPIFVMTIMRMKKK